MLYGQGTGVLGEGRFDRFASRVRLSLDRWHPRGYEPFETW